MSGIVEQKMHHLNPDKFFHPPTVLRCSIAGVESIDAPPIPGFWRGVFFAKKGETIPGELLISEFL